jgi:dTDP-4-dehydrorhamnose 3,5-epimerase
MDDSVKFISGDNAVDDRGELIFCNNWLMSTVKRFYQVKNHQSGFVRAWHGHRKESKFVLAVQGSILFGAVKVDNWKRPSTNLEVERFVLSDRNPGILSIPAGYAHGYKTLTDGASVIFFSTASIEESIKDDYRFDAFYWDPPWDIVER